MNHISVELSEAKDLKDEAAIALLRQIQREPILVPWAGNNPIAVPTAYVRQGLGQCPIVLLPGFDSSLLEFRRLFPLLAAQRETWAIDPFGFGFTTYVKEMPLNPATIGLHLYQFWKEKIQQPVTLLGASLGGAMAIDFALNYPDCVSELVLVDSVGFSGSFPIGQLIVPPIDTLAAQWLRFRKRVALMAANLLPNADPMLVDAIRCALLHHEMPGWSEAIISFTKSGGYSNLVDRIFQVRHPTLILWGVRDDVLGTEDARLFRGAIDHSKLVWIQSGHVPHLEEPNATAAAILNYGDQHFA